MSFGIYLYREPGGGKAERATFRTAMKRWGWDGSAGSPYHLGTDTGITVELYMSCLAGSGPFDAGNLEIRHLDTELCRLVLDLARAGRFTISSDADPGAVILLDEEQRATLGADPPPAMVCVSPEELEAALDGGFEAWQEYRRRATGEPNS